MDKDDYISKGNGNNYDLIDVAQKQIRQHSDFLSNEKSTYTGSGNWFSSKVITELKKSGLYYVTFTPDFFECRSMIRLDPYKIYGAANSAMRRTLRAKIRSVPPLPPHWATSGGTSKFITHAYINNLVERMLERHERLKYGHKLPLGRWRIEVGILDPYKLHRPPEKRKPIRYGLLMAVLMNLGYDPLLPIRMAKFVKEIQIDMAKSIITAINEGRYGSPLAIESRLSAIAMRVESYVKAYIHGGRKPKLADRTIANRMRRYPNAIYPDGFDEPLSETGQLADAISYRVIGENEWVKDMGKVKRQKDKVVKVATASATKVANAANKQNEQLSQTEKANKEQEERLERFKREQEKKKKKRIEARAKKILSKGKVTPAQALALAMGLDKKQESKAKANTSVSRSDKALAKLSEEIDKQVRTGRRLIGSAISPSPEDEKAAEQARKNTYQAQFREKYRAIVIMCRGVLIPFTDKYGRSIKNLPAGALDEQLSEQQRDLLRSVNTDGNITTYRDVYNTMREAVDVINKLDDEAKFQEMTMYDVGHDVPGRR